MVANQEVVEYKTMGRVDKSKWLKRHQEEIVADIRSMSIREVLEKWPFGTTTFFKLRKVYAPEMIGKHPPVTHPRVDVPQGLSEHEQYLVLIGYQMAVREFLTIDKMT